jgi:hypothetical protein
VEYLLSRNYGHFTVNEYTNQEFVSVTIANGNYENLKFGGVIKEIDCDEGETTCFRFNPSYRESFSDGWIYTTDDATLQGYIDNAIVYIVVNEQKKPVLYPRIIIV